MTWDVEDVTVVDWLHVRNVRRTQDAVWSDVEQVEVLYDLLAGFEVAEHRP